ncbi:PP2C family serine/threonine-protein phosphatase [Sphaerimonospora thailandensis]|uniref:PPM-type phosphatase domain-containing protein n=1 Tax=Sphaerimonospora thailandensis TaxID=795644 RepID=A0A8J3VWF6_9ACTN|nr:PP2C family serine/threonine-protein phosphatase [Sphaerimonospora thailandensis]GIH67759.1 hypothetical protein Mth01_00120 [Sphaerimonospora thailandensis]
MEQVQGAARAEAVGADAVPAFPEPLVIGRRPRVLSRPGPLPQVRRPDTEIDGADLRGLVVRATSIRGDAHRYFGTPRQDAMGLWHDGDRTLLACVADGLGSKERSHLGAATACEVAPDRLPGLSSPTELGTAARSFIESIAREINERAARESVTPDQLSTTFLAAVVEETPDGSRHHAYIMRVGDCDAWHLYKGEWAPCFAEADGDEAVATSTTRALPRDFEHVEVVTVDLYPGDMLLLCTDGLGRPLLRVPQVRKQLAEWWSRPDPPSLPEFFWQMSFQAKTYDDDRTAVCLWRV